MFVRIKHSDHNGRSYEYLQIVKSVRKGKKVRQRLIANLGVVARNSAGDNKSSLVGRWASLL